jgi:hypothetical protein
VRHPGCSAGDRVFYESLFKEKPTSEMALLWCVEHGVFPAEAHERMYKEYARIKARPKGVTGSAASGASSKPKAAPGSASRE